MKKVDEKECIERLKNCRNGEYTLVGNYKSFAQKATIRHCCGYEWDTIPKTIYGGIASCPVCAGHLCNKQEILDFLKSKHLEIINIDEHFTLQKKYKIRCLECGYIWETTLSPLIQNLKNCGEEREYGCPKCYNKIKMRLSPDDFTKRFESLNTDYEIIKGYEKSDVKMTFKCKKCGQIFDRYPADIFRYDCPKCGATSKNELDIYNFIKDYYPSTEFRNRTLLSGKEIDIYIPELKLGFEFDGLYWHSDNKLDKNYHYNKMQLANSLGVRIINIFEDEYLTNKDLILSKIKHIISKDKSISIYGRNCVVKEITCEEKNIFLDKYHIQGHDHASYYIGGYYNNELIAVMTFANPSLGRGNNKFESDVYELSRYCVSNKYNVIGIFGKLLKYFENKYKPSQVYSFADLRWTDQNNNIYLNNNFIQDSITSPTYYYCLHGQRFHKFGFRKTEIRHKFPEIYNKDLTEFEMMDKTQYTRIWDCGKIKYVKTY